MEWLETHWLRLLFVAAYLVMLAKHCVTARGRTGDLGEFLIASRSLGGWLIALSFYATFVSTNTFVGHAGKSWDVGLIWYVKGAVIVLCAYAAWHLVAPRFFELARKCDSVTLPDLLGYRYASPNLRRASALVIFIASALFLVAVYKGSSIALEQFLGLDYRVGAVVIFLVVTAYTLAGGFRAVVLTDAVQGLLMLVGAVTMIIAVLWRAGGLSAALETIRAQDPHLVSWQGNLPLMAILGLSIAGGMKLLVDPRQISRLYGLKDRRALGKARLIAPLLILLTYVCMLPIGAFAHALIPPDAISDSDRVIPFLLGSAEMLGPFLSSFFLLVILSAAMSSLDSVLLVAASSIGRDVVILPDNDPRTFKRTRLWVVVLSFVSMLLALNPFGDIVSITAFSGSLYAACFLPTLVGGLYWKRGTAAGALACVVSGAIIVIAWHFLRRSGWVEWHEVYIGLLVGLVAYVAGSFVSSARTWIRTRNSVPATGAEPASQRPL